ncbi:hypothetical protein [Thermococcus sibiricus]|nr:hypothetical protein [Thermococcus sibiricus]KUK18648.1 MAG: Uncharacterized protein XD54_0033 [Thermococcus sibiricus]KUK27897.1 MAG: Uncharacterized protein XD61_1565 [Thermococcus sp. 40_45]
MDNMVWITFFLTLLAGAITALIGVHIQHWYSSRKTRERLINTLKSELNANRRLIESNLNSLKQSSDGLLMFPLKSRAYEHILFEYPSLFRECYEKGNEMEEIIAGIYSAIDSFNLLQQALTYNFVALTDKNKESMEDLLKRIDSLIERIIKLIEKEKK